MNSVSYLLHKSFSLHTLEEKLEIKRLGRPLPELNIVKTQYSSKQKERCRKFNRTIYSRNNWLCGCEEKNALYCFPCVLFGLGGEPMWSRTGTDDLVHIWENSRTHEKSKIHMNSVLSLSLLGKGHVQTSLKLAYRRTLAQHNEQVDKNREVLNVIIKWIRFCGAHNLPLRNPTATGDPQENELFQKLIDFEFDKEVKRIAKASVFNRTSKTILNELLECVLEVYHAEVAKEIKDADFIAVIANETSDVSSEFQLVVILRYLVGDKPVERFWNFVNLEGHDPSSIACCIVQEIDPLIAATPNKLIAVSYDGALVTSEGLNGLQTLIKDKYLYANLVHYYAHQVNSIICKAASVQPQVRIFFSYLSRLCSFLSSSSLVATILDEVMEDKFPQLLHTNCNFRSCEIKTVYEYRIELIKVMDILESRLEFNSTITQVDGHKLRLQNRDFLFWLNVFHQVMPHVETIFNQLQRKNTDSVRVTQNLQNFGKSLKKICEQIEDIGESDYENSKREATETCEAIVQQIKTRFHFIGHLVAANLFMMARFTEYQKRFPKTYLNEVVEAFPFLEKNRLKCELQVFYHREELQHVSGVVSLLSLVLEDDLRCTFQETLKLLRVIVTIPVSTPEAERCFSTLKRINAFLRNSMKGQRANALGMLSVEKGFLDNIDNFNEKVIDLFISKTKQRIDFIHGTL